MLALRSYALDEEQERTQRWHELHSEPTNKAIIIQNIEKTQEIDI